MDRLDSKIREKAKTDLKPRLDAVTKLLPQSVTLEEFIEWKQIENIDILIDNKKGEISNRQQALKKATEIKSKGTLEKINLSIFPPAFTALLKKELKDIAVAAEEKVRSQIDTFKMGKEGEAWLSQGLGFVKDEKCPFCGSIIASNELISAYQSHFNAEYKTLKAEVGDMKSLVISAIGETAIGKEERKLSENSVLVEFWKQFFAVDIPAVSFTDIHAKYLKLREMAVSLADLKQQNPVESIAPEEEFIQALDEVKGRSRGQSCYYAFSEKQRGINRLSVPMQ